MYKTLEEACEEAPEGSVITIKPGKYTLKDTIVLSRTITLCSETDKAEDVTIDCQESTTFVINDGNPSFQNLTISNCNENAYAFYITGGTPQLFKCVITAPQSAGIGVEGEKANPLVTKCVIKDCKIVGVVVCEGGLGKFSDCEIYGISGLGITVMDSGNPTVIKCKIQNSGNSGIGVFDAGLGEFINCEIYENQGFGIQITKWGNPTFIQCKIHDGDNSGVLVHSNGLGLFLNCKIYRNNGAGIEVRESGNPFVTRCIIHNEKGCGLFVHTDGEGQFWDCKIYRNKLAGIIVEE